MPPHKRTHAQLVERQGLPLQMKIGMSQQRIHEWYEHFEGKVYVAFSGGKDSTVLLDLVRDIYPEVPPLSFVILGLSTLKFVTLSKRFLMSLGSNQSCISRKLSKGTGIQSSRSALPKVSMKSVGQRVSIFASYD